MQEPELNSATAYMMATACVLSFTAGFYLFQRHVEGRPLLAYEPRRRVPWGPLVLAIPLFFLVINFLPQADDTDSMTPDQFVFNGLVVSAIMVGFVVIAMAWLISDGRADRHDLGLTDNRAQFWKDIASGVVACLAALLPIYVINFSLVITFHSQKQHPIVENLIENSSPEMLLMGFVSAVLAAPLFEEFTFRVLLQGWLERVEDERLSFHATSRQDFPVEEEPGTAEPTNGEIFERFSAEPTLPEGMVVIGQPPPRPEHGWLSALPHGWTPILVSSVFFGLAHIGHGVAPVPLMFLGVVLGYLYQRTHRIVPSIVAHMLFNAYSMTLLWLSLESPPS